ncbi:Protein translation factor SUI1-like protein [Diplonema papillatum]|nr:Protein translation factor SUI1-like protein [Diplonema papillatum]
MSSGFVTATDAPDFLAGADPLGQQTSESVASKKDNAIVHIRCQQRNGRKCITSIQGLHPELDYKRLLKAFKKQFSCNGSIVEDKDLGTVLQLQGDQRENASNFLSNEGITKKGSLVTHGF